MGDPAPKKVTESPVILFHQEDDKDVALSFDRRRVLVYNFTPSGRPKQQVIHDEWPAKRASVIDTRLRRSGAVAEARAIRGQRIVEVETVMPYATFSLNIKQKDLKDVEKDLVWRAAESGWKRACGRFLDACEKADKKRWRYEPGDDPFPAMVFRYLYQKDLILVEEANPDPEAIRSPTDWIRHEFLLEATGIRRRPLRAIKPKVDLSRIAW